MPNVSVDGPALRYEFSGIRIGSAEYEVGPTGATVIVFEHSAKGAVDVRGDHPERSILMRFGFHTRSRS